MVLLAASAGAQVGTVGEPERTILAVGAHAGDMELTAGAVLIRQRRLGDRVVLLYLTLGEGGNPQLSPSACGAQERAEALAVAEIMGAEVRDHLDVPLSGLL
jgi:N-acetylglucosamine malate deacetylase 1